MPKENIDQEPQVGNPNAINQANSKEKDRNKMSVLLFLILFLSVIAALLYFFYDDIVFKESSIDDESQELTAISSEKEYSMQKFESEEEFKDFISENENYGYYGGFSRNLAMPAPEMMVLDSVSIGASESVGLKGAPSRVSSTNVQVRGIDEPDIVKTDGENIYSSIMRNTFYERNPTPLPLQFDEPEIEIAPEISAQEDRIMAEPEERIIRPAPGFIPEPQIKEALTNIIKAYPPEEMKTLSGIDEQGDLLVVNDKLIVFDAASIKAYEVSNPSLPVESWEIPYGDRTTYHDARLYGDELYLITKTGINHNNPCPISPIMAKGSNYTIPCLDIYYPSNSDNIDVTYTVLKIDTSNGEIKDDIAFVGNGYESVVYMSPENIYVTHTFMEDYFEIMASFVIDNPDLFNDEFVNKVKEIASYDLSSNAKMVEFENMMNKLQMSMSEDEALAFNNNLNDRTTDYLAKRVRDFQTTGIAKISRNNLDVDATGYVPGKPLNQFSLDEHDSNFRIVTTSDVANNFGATTDSSINDVYVLDRNMKVIGSAEDLGKGERVYSARFIGDEGYVVTFKQIDPFYVLDLSNPKDPKVTGELKIPGYSSYLHPLQEDLILGIGKEGSQVKLSLFDVSNPADPKEVDKYMLDEYWSDVLNTHHAFLLDSEYEVFFLPGSRGGYVISYSDDQLSMETAVSDVGAERALYLDDYLYVIGRDGIAVLDEKTWEKTAEFEY